MSRPQEPEFQTGADDGSARGNARRSPEAIVPSGLPLEAPVLEDPNGVLGCAYGQSDCDAVTGVGICMCAFPFKDGERQ